MDLSLITALSVCGTWAEVMLYMDRQDISLLTKPSRIFDSIYTAVAHSEDTNQIFIVRIYERPEGPFACFVEPIR